MKPLDIQVKAENRIVSDWLLYYPERLKEYEEAQELVAVYPVGYRTSGHIGGDRVPECIWCDVPMKKIGVGGLVCPECGGRWIPSQKISGLQILRAWQDEQRYKRSISKRGGGSKSGRKRDKPKQTKTVYYET